VEIEVKTVFNLPVQCNSLQAHNGWTVQLGKLAFKL